MVDEPNKVVTDEASLTGAEENKALEPLTAEAIQKAISEGTERALREIQSQKDRAIQEVRSGSRQTARVTDNSFDYLRGELAGLDPDVAKDVELAALRARAKASQDASVQTQQETAAQNFRQEFTDSLTSLAESAGIDKNDKALDWAEDAGTDYLTRMKRFQTSVVKVIKAGAGAAAKDAEAAKNAREIEARKAAGLESHDTRHAGGDSAVLTDEAFLQNFADGIAPMTKENRKRAEALIAKNEKLLI